MLVQKTVIACAVASVAVLALAAPAGASGLGVTSAPEGAARHQGASSPATVDTSAAPDVTGQAAAAVGFAITKATCFSDDVAFTADTFERGFSGVQYLRQKAQLQEFVGGWVNRTGVSVVTSNRFPNDGRSFHFVRDWDGNHVANGDHWRVVWQGVYANGGGVIVARTRPITITC